jgi:chloride channel protein, CIC family
MMAAAKQADLSQPLVLSGSTTPITVSPRDTLRECAVMMAETKLTSFPVVNADGKLVGVIMIDDLLKGRSEQSQRENMRERVLRLRWPFGGRGEEVVTSDK